jgi:hypothetical protein
MTDGAHCTLLFVAGPVGIYVISKEDLFSGVSLRPKPFCCYTVSPKLHPGLWMETLEAPLHEGAGNFWRGETLLTWWLQNMPECNGTPRRGLLVGVIASGNLA